MYQLKFPNAKFTHEVRQSLINSIVREYNFLTLGSIGKSICGREISYIRVGNPKKMNLWVAAHHGMEWITSMVVLKFLDRVCDTIRRKETICGIDFKRSFNQKGLVIIPCLNPDGVDISLWGKDAAGKYSELVNKVSGGNTSRWQANARGVDLNHNYDADWQALHELEIKNGIDGPRATRFGGPHPQSEPETKALVDFCQKNNFEIATAFHSQGEEIYWNYGPNTPKVSETIANILALASGYTVSQPEGLAVGGGFKDWFIQKMKRPAFTIELGKGENPLPASSLEQIYNKIEKSLLISAVM